MEFDPGVIHGIKAGLVRIEVVCEEFCGIFLIAVLIMM